VHQRPGVVQRGRQIVRRARPLCPGCARDVQQARVERLVVAEVEVERAAARDQRREAIAQLLHGVRRVGAEVVHRALDTGALAGPGLALRIARLHEQDGALTIGGAVEHQDRV